MDTAARCEAVGTAYDLFYHRLDPETREKFAVAILNLGLEPARQSYYGTGVGVWPSNTNNWNVVCSNGIMIGAFAVMSEYEQELCADLAEKSLRSLEIMMHQFAPEGAWFEGSSYWHYTIQNVVPLANAYYRMLGSDHGMMGVPGIKTTGYFPVMTSGNTGAFAYHDSPIYYRGNIMELFWLARTYDDSALARLRLNDMEKYHYKGNILDMLWFDDSNLPDEVTLPLDKYYSYSEVAASRSGWDENAAFLAVHAGKNKVAHGQVDMGSFEYEVFGKRFASDMGKDDYNLPGTSTTRTTRDFPIM